jgi:hypothetical protein
MQAWALEAVIGTREECVSFMSSLLSKTYHFHISGSDKNEVHHQTSEDLQRGERTDWELRLRLSDSRGNPQRQSPH